MEYTVTAPLTTLVTIAAGVGKTTRPQCVPEHQSVRREGCDILTMLTLLLICTPVYTSTVYHVLSMYRSPCSRRTEGHSYIFRT